MTLLTDRRYKDHSMEDISDLVGFSNRQSFYASFYKINGSTPRDYRLEHMPPRPESEEKKPAKRGRRPKVMAEVTIGN